MASAGRMSGLDGWKQLAGTLAHGIGDATAAGLRSGYHNHQTEFTPIDGKRPMEVIAANTPKDFMLQLDVGTCVEVGSDPVAWIEANPGRINCLHLKDWAPGEQARATASCSARASCRGRRFSRPRKSWAAWSIT